MQPPALNHVALKVNNLALSQHFYEVILRLPRIERPAFTFDGLWFRLGTDQELHLICRRVGHAGKGARADDTPPKPEKSRDNHFALLVDDIDNWEQHLAQLGANYQPRKMRPDGALQIFVIDPDGHHIELCTRPAKA